MKRTIILAIFIAALSFTYSFETQGTFTFNATQDTSINGEGENNMNTNLGAETNMRMGHPPHIKNALVKFSTDEIIAAIGTSHVVSAYLQLYVETNFNNWGSGSYIDAYRVSYGWDEMTATWHCGSDSNVSNNQPIATICGMEVITKTVSRILCFIKTLNLGGRVMM